MILLFMRIAMDAFRSFALYTLDYLYVYLHYLLENTLSCHIIAAIQEHL